MSSSSDGQSHGLQAAAQYSEGCGWGRCSVCYTNLTVPVMFSVMIVMAFFVQTLLNLTILKLIHVRFIFPLFILFHPGILRRYSLMVFMEAV